MPRLREVQSVEARPLYDVKNVDEARRTSPLTEPLFPLESGSTSMWYAES